MPPMFWRQINMKGLDGIQGPAYVGTRCVFNRQALYCYDPPVSEKRPKMACDCWPSWCCCCCGGSRKSNSEERGKAKLVLWTIHQEEENDGEELSEKRFWTCLWSRRGWRSWRIWRVGEIITLSQKNLEKRLESHQLLLLPLGFWVSFYINKLKFILV